MDLCTLDEVTCRCVDKAAMVDSHFHDLRQILYLPIRQAMLVNVFISNSLSIDLNETEKCIERVQSSVH